MSVVTLIDAVFRGDQLMHLLNYNIFEFRYIGYYFFSIQRFESRRNDYGGTVTCF